VYLPNGIYIRRTVGTNVTDDRQTDDATEKCIVIGGITCAHERFRLTIITHIYKALWAELHRQRTESNRIETGNKSKVFNCLLKPDSKSLSETLLAGGLFQTTAARCLRR